MKALLVSMGAVIVCSAAIGAAPASAGACMSDYAFKAEIGRLVDSSNFLATVEDARSLEEMRNFDLLHREFVSQKAEPLPSLPTPCTKSAAFRDAVGRATLVKQSLRRVASLVAAFPSTRAASRAQWRPVLVAATAGTAAALRLATDIGSSKIRLSQLATQLAALRVQMKQ